MAEEISRQTTSSAAADGVKKMAGVYQRLRPFFAMSFR